MSDENQRGAGVFERHAQTGLTILAVALLSWLALTTQRLDVNVGILTNEVNHLKVSVEIPQRRVDDLTRRVERLEQVTGQ